MHSTNGIITIAIGKKYISQAKYLAYSCMLHAPQVIRAVITDRPEALSSYYDRVISYNPEYGDPFAVKTRLYWYTPFEKTLYVDADSLVINHIDTYWDALRERSFAYNGKMITEGDWYFDISTVMKQVSVPWIPKFNSGMFLFDKSEKAKSIFDMAYDYLHNQKKKKLDVDFFRKEMLPDEPFLAIALAKHDEEPYEDYGRFSRTLIGAKHIHVDVIKGLAFFTKNEEPVFPSIIHFCGRFGQFLFLQEKLKLFFYVNPPVSTMFTMICSLIRRIFKKSI
ncbi:MAG: hypothetical protein LBT14_10720 [Treponema sp.]|jgi:hypothetical protein|nr:hypothetical protein [Treponema sp.]